MKRVALAVLAACGSHDDPAPPKPQPVKDTVTAQLAACVPALPRPIDPRESELPVPGYQQVPRGGPTSPQIVLDQPSVTGKLDKGVVRRYLRRNTARFQYCYERVLVRRPQIGSGTIEASFAIQANGIVARAQADGVDADVATCVADSIALVEFPQPTDGNQVQVTVKIQVTAPGKFVADAPPHAPPTHEWTPFAARDEVAPDLVSAPVARAVAPSVTSRLAAIDRCFDGARGKVRAIFAFDRSGATPSLRVGGLGDAAIESCIATALAGITVAVPAGDVEIACDLVRGGDAPFRVSPDAGYTVVELTSREIRNHSSVRDIPPRAQTHTVTALGVTSAVLVIAEPDAPAAAIDAALWWAPAGATLVAVKASGGAPVLVGMGDSRAQRIAKTGRRVIQLRTDGGRLRACIGDTVVGQPAPLVAAHAMDALMKAIGESCFDTPCEPTIVVGTSGDFEAKDLVATTSAAHRAGYQSISIGGSACD